MQKLLAYILFVVMIGQTFNQVWCYVGYLVEKKEYMARCENKDRPQLHCDGKCQLMKKIAEQEKRDRGSAPELKLTAKGDIVSSRSYFVLSPAFNMLSAGSQTFFPRSIGSPIDRNTSLFHPPNNA